MYLIFKKGEMFLTTDESDKALENIDTFLEHYSWLVHYSIGRGVLNYAIVTKTHMLWHIAHLSRYLNTRFCWTYQFEDFMNTMVVAAKACIAGSSMHVVGNKVMQNYTLVLDLMLRIHT